MATETLSFNLRAIDNASGVFSKVGDSAGKTSEHFGRIGASMGAIGRAAGAGVLALAGVAAAGLTAGVKTASSMEQARISFTTMLGSATKADSFLKEMANFAAKTPFEFPELQTAASSLVSVGIKAKDVIPIMTSLGNATSGMGTGSEGIKRATVALQQMTAAGKITGQDLNQLRDAGIPVYDLLSKATGKSTAEVAKLAAAGKLGHKELSQMMNALVSGKGMERFSGLMDKQSTSLAGLWSTLKDTLNMGLAQAVQPLIPLLKDGMGGAIAFLTAHMPQLAAGLSSVVTHVQAWFSAQNGGRGADFAGMLQRVGDAARLMWPQIQSAATQMHGIKPIVDVSAAAFGFLAAHIDTFVKYLPLIIAGFVVWKAAQAAANAVALARLPIDGAMIVSNFALAGANKALAAQMAISNGVENVGLITRLRATVATVASTTASIAASVATKVWAATQWLLNAAFLANPIGLVVVGIGLLVAGIILAYKHSETFRIVVNSAFHGVQTVVGNVVAALIDAFHGLADVWATVIGGFIHAAASIATTLHLPFASGLRKVDEEFQKAKTKVDGTLSRLADSARGWGDQAGQNLALGFGHGISANSEAALNAAGAMANKAVGILNKVLITNSPSRVTFGIGQFFSEGFHLGIKDGHARAVKAVEDLATKVVDKLKTLQQRALDIRTSIAGAFTGAFDVGGIGATGAASAKPTASDIESASIAVERARLAAYRPDQTTLDLRDSNLALSNAINNLADLQAKAAAPDAATASPVAQFADFSAQAAQFAAALATAAAHGIDGSIIGKIANLGPTQGLVAATAIANLDPSSVASVNRDTALAVKFAAQVGTVVLSTTDLPEKIARDKDILATLKLIHLSLDKERVNVNLAGVIGDRKDVVRWVRAELDDLLVRNGKKKLGV